MFRLTVDIHFQNTLLLPLSLLLCSLLLPNCEGSHSVRLYNIGNVNTKLTAMSMKIETIELIPSRCHSTPAYATALRQVSLHSSRYHSTPADVTALQQMSLHSNRCHCTPADVTAFQQLSIVYAFSRSLSSGQLCLGLYIGILLANINFSRYTFFANKHNRHDVLACSTNFQDLVYILQISIK